MTDYKPPKVFISYAWEDDVKIWVRAFATRLRKDGVETIFDEWAAIPGDQLPEFMEKSIRESDFVLVICTPKYKNKSDNRAGGVGYEGDIITSELITTRNQRKFIPVLRKGAWIEAAPSWVLGKYYIDLQGRKYNDNYQELLRTLHNKRETPPPIGGPPDFGKKNWLAEFNIALKEFLSTSFTALKSTLSKAFPFLRVAGFAGIVIGLLWGGAWAVPKFVSLIPTPRATTTQSPTVQPISTKTPVLPTKTPIPSATPTKRPTLTPTLGIGSTMTSEKDGMKLVYVPAGEFTMGSDADDVVAGCKKFEKVITDCQRTRFTDEEPLHSVNVDVFWIDQTEVTNAMYEKCVSAGACKEPMDLSYFGSSEFDNYPVLFVDWNMAKAYCSWVGRRLPTEAEWEKAARGTHANIYPWGNAFDGSVVNFCDTNCGISHADESVNDGYGDVSPVGNYPSGQSIYGAYDMAGNVWEWVSSLYRPYPYDASDGRENLSSLESRVLRGGSWNSDGNVVRSAGRIYVTPDKTSWNFGFRCAWSP